MSKYRLINRLKWYYPLERFHTFVTFPFVTGYCFLTYPFNEIIFLAYGLIVCTVILYQGQKYWKLKLHKLKGKRINQESNLTFFKKAKRLNRVLLGLQFPVLVIQLYTLDWQILSAKLFVTGVFVNVFAILEYINYYHTQLMIDNKYDLKYVFRNKRLKKASLAKDLDENEI